MPDIKRAGGHVLTDDHGWVLADEVEAEAPQEEDELDEFHTGGGWYQIGDEKVRGKDAAREALEALNGTE